MKYEVMYGILETEIYGDYTIDIVDLLGYNAEYKKTKEEVYSILKRNITNAMREKFNRVKNDDYTLSFEESIVTYNSKINPVEKYLPYYRDLNIDILEKGYIEINPDIYIFYTIKTIKPKLYKSNESDIDIFGKYKNEMEQKNKNIDNSLKIKNYIWASSTVITPDYEYEDRNLFISDTITNISNNLSYLMNSVKKDMMNDYYTLLNYLELEKTDDFFFFRDRRPVDLISNLKNYSYHVGYDYCISDDNGVNIQHKFLLIPIVSYYKNGDNKCGEK